MKGLFRSKFAGATALVGFLLLIGCHKGGNEVNPAALGPNPFPDGVPQGVTAPPGAGPANAAAASAKLQLVFVRHELTDYIGAPVVAFPSPPYIIGTANNGAGQLSALDISSIGLQPMLLPPRVPYGSVTADLHGTGVPDVISAVYSPTNAESYAYLFQGSSTGVFSQDLTFGADYPNPAGGYGYRGRTETVVVADFNNDGAVDVFLPTYTYLDCAHDLSGQPATYCTGGPPPNVYNARQSFLLLNDGKGNFSEAAVAAGISMHSVGRLSGIAERRCQALGELVRVPHLPPAGVVSTANSNSFPLPASGVSIGIS